ncbi:MAG: hypothetical protein HY001_04080 [Candidatus Portnoybacteria bacterium]|nr:hypothetical protein [Candidatus Portnoybacteria bacterium]
MINKTNFLLTNNLGGYFWYNKKSYSRYQGWFLVFQGRMIKIIDSFEGRAEAIHFPRFSDTLIIENNYYARTIINFDIRESYQTPQWNRIYTISKKDGIWWVRCDLEPIVVGIKVQGSAQVIGRWAEKNYSFDKERSSPPFSLWVYQGIEIKAKRIIIAAGKNEDEVLEELKRIKDLRFKIEDLRLSAYELARESLLSLRVYNKEQKLLGLFAGLPWFFQFWLRDMAVSAKALGFFEPEEAKTLLEKHIHLLGTPCPAYCDLQQKEAHLRSIDGPLWVAFRLKELERYSIFQSYENLEFITNNAKETWMDTIPREGARIEHQALKLAILKGNPLEKPFWEKVKTRFFHTGMLVDGIEVDGRVDWTKRPNVFLAAYVYPDLLSKKDWEAVFDAHLQALWLSWGGLSTIDQKHPDFHPLHTGEAHFRGEENTPASYHQGDSWFWINNIAAITMHRINAKKYAKYIKKIFDASSNDILKKGIPGHASEVSSAGKFEPDGSLSQAWSAATFIELWQELDGLRNSDSRV